MNATVQDGMTSMRFGYDQAARPEISISGDQRNQNIGNEVEREVRGDQDQEVALPQIDCRRNGADEERDQDPCDALAVVESGEQDQRDSGGPEAAAGQRFDPLDRKAAIEDFLGDAGTHHNQRCHGQRDGRAALRPIGRAQALEAAARCRKRARPRMRSSSPGSIILPDRSADA